jgi:hypothetical protein
MELKSATRYIGKILQGIDKKPFYVIGVRKDGIVYALPSTRDDYIQILAPYADYDESHPTSKQYRDMIFNAFRLSGEYLD